MNGEREPSFHDQLPAIYRPMNPKVEIIIGAILTSIPAIRAHDAFTQGFNNNGWFLLAASGFGMFHIIKSARRLVRERKRQHFG
ncbi:MAG: hypothetical protein UU73_C0002G0010 [Candidatus Daviesbacteria bacterium GW2011_GWA1_41_61]|uniref:Uncharacterized protein n=1 Tax=Candidatus Daviesbacteria bacterium GW2011_GWA2_40_9 TaxID=1618424 RepID=A0A0G0WHD2_9BACT|nr:MAG: hypothetical protein UU26_C0008G0023 [Candidatus Daviesbacteria bacterium GW2011_GWC1_40_9]KKR83735.1 MAG: hypothetical protein UU29_C0002G0048 [Candidatus Daviesbacteria bacterium GW2011_GWA2_40_9]KKR93670.1 MAG: hypothetical protein UU44_C0001G0010 [Candidatus Daviesbacteria bacterium GW2011_GWB1_41_15]KKS15136.1 MAG: hypothetical protein UU73_C0002G0010 [Candidatus Daviesbacteria bacterium GW2011_GWA1_41_61]